VYPRQWILREQIDMATMGPSRPQRSKQPADTSRLTETLRKILDILVGRHHSGRSKYARQRAGSRPPLHKRVSQGFKDRRADRFVRTEISLWRLAILIGVLAIAIWAAWRIVADTAAQNLAASDPAAALSWRARESTALDQRATQELLRPDADFASAVEWARQALRSNPLDAQAVMLLGLIAEREGHVAKADALMQIAGSRTWRDWTIQSWLFNSDVRRGDYVSAIPHLNAILRADPSLRPQLFPVIAALTFNSDAAKALTAFLATSPPWRAWFLSELSARSTSQPRLVQLYTALSESDRPPTREELAPYLDRLVRDGNFKLAYQTWHDRLPAALQASGRQPFNRDFNVPLDGSPFNWVLTDTPGAEIRIVPVPEDGGRKALRVQFSGARVNFANVRQLLVLPPGNYILAGRVKAEDFTSPRGLWWRVFCAGAGKDAATIAQTPLVAETTSWSDFSVGLQIPQSGCEAQWLQLELPARIASEAEISGQVWYQYLRITPKSREGAGSYAPPDPRQ
jgi:tetratricopeptide (TPR) repeat protein